MDVESAPPLPKQGDPFHSNEKVEEKHGVVEASEPFQGDVYDDIRAIDIGEDGKERPIGMSYLSFVLPVSCSSLF